PAQSRASRPRWRGRPSRSRRRAGFPARNPGAARGRAASSHGLPCRRRGPGRSRRRSNPKAPPPTEARPRARRRGRRGGSRATRPASSRPPRRPPRRRTRAAAHRRRRRSRPQAPRRPRERCGAGGAGRARRRRRRTASAEGALELAEQAFGLAVCAFVGMLVELVQQAPLLVRQTAGYEDVDEDALVAAATALQDRHAAAVQDGDLAGLRSGRKLDLFLAVEGRDRESGPERSLREGQVGGRVDVVSLAHEPLVGTDVNFEIDVSRLAACRPGVTLAAQPDPLAVVDSGRDLDRERALLDDTSRAPALGAPVLDATAGYGARRAGLGADELAEHAPRHLLEPPCSVARRARRQLGARLGAVPVATAARDGSLERDLARNAVRRLDQVDLDGRREVGAADTAASAAAAEQDLVAEEGGKEIGEAAEVDVARVEAAAAQARVAVAVVEVARLAFREHLVRLHDLTEPLFRVG